MSEFASIVNCETPRVAEGGSASLNELEVYREAMAIAEIVWSAVSAWNDFQKKTVGSQIIRSADSIAANLAEGHGRYHFKENRKFCYYSRGSLEETLTFVEKAANRGLMEKDQARELYRRLTKLQQRLNRYIQSIGTQHQ